MKKKTLHYFIVITLLICSNSNAQKSNFIVTTSQDTIYVDEINLTGFEVKTKIADKKKSYKIDEISSFYKSKENEYYELVKLNKNEPKKIDKYDYRRNENLYIENYDKRIKYEFLERLTVGKVKLLTEVLIDAAVGSPGQPGFMASRKNKIYYIAIPGSSLELISDFGELKLTKKVYEMLKIYLYGNIEIEKKLDNLFLSKPTAKEKQIIDLINEYNIWVKSNK